MRETNSRSHAEPATGGHGGISRKDAKTRRGAPRAGYDDGRLLSPTSAAGGNRGDRKDSGFVGFGFRDTGIAASDDAWKELMKGVDAAMTELRKAFEEPATGGHGGISRKDAKTRRGAPRAGYDDGRLRAKWRYELTRLGRAVLGALACLGCILLTGCAFDRAIEAAADSARSISVALIEKSTITETSATAGGSINNPHYRVLAVAVQGVYLDIGLDGVTVQGNISGQGGGPDKPLSDKAAAAIREKLLQDDDFMRLLTGVVHRLETGATSPPVAPSTE